MNFHVHETQLLLHIISKYKPTYGLHNNNKEKKMLNIRNKRQIYHRVKIRKISKDKKTDVNFLKATVEAKM